MTVLGEASKYKMWKLHVYYIIPASSLVKHIGGLIRKTFPWIPPFPTRTPSSTMCIQQTNESLGVIIWKRKLHSHELVLV